jgi:hypothetical protein
LIDPSGAYVMRLCGGGFAAFGMFGQADLCFAVAMTWPPEFGLTRDETAGISLGAGLGGMLTLRLSNAKHIVDVAGTSAGASAAVGVSGVFGAGLGYGRDRCGARRWDVSGSGGVGASLRYSIHKSQTFVKVLMGDRSRACRPTDAVAAGSKP